MDIKMKYLFIIPFLIIEISAQDYTKLIEKKEAYLREKQQQTRSMPISQGFNELLQVVFTKESDSQSFTEQYRCIEQMNITQNVRVYRCQGDTSLETFITSVKNDTKYVVDIRKYKKYKFKTF